MTAFHKEREHYTINMYVSCKKHANFRALKFVWGKKVCDARNAEVTKGAWKTFSCIWHLERCIIHSSIHRPMEHLDGCTFWSFVNWWFYIPFICFLRTSTSLFMVKSNRYYFWNESETVLHFFLECSVLPPRERCNFILAVVDLLENKRKCQPFFMVLCFMYIASLFVLFYFLPLCLLDFIDCQWQFYIFFTSEFLEMNLIGEELLFLLNTDHPQLWYIKYSQ